ncbi:hypothetical protein K502DRAFT_328774 [Neoconidiobolus thromboides FSU 785]|nr:hypothetical protein K502DRAFT_328774 [Neoconidiobolus thromboides FSU 785]
MGKISTTCSLYNFEFYDQIIMVPYEPEICPHLFIPSYSGQEAGASAIIYYLNETQSFPNLYPYQPHLLSSHWNSTIDNEALKIPVLFVTSTMAKLLKYYSLTNSNKNKDKKDKDKDKEDISLLSIITHSKYKLKQSENLLFQVNNKENENSQLELIIATDWDNFNSKDDNSNQPSSNIILLELLRIIDKLKLKLKYKLQFHYYSKNFEMGLGIKQFLKNNPHNEQQYYLYLKNIQNFNLQLLNTEELPSNIQQQSEYLKNLLKLSLSVINNSTNFNHPVIIDNQQLQLNNSILDPLLDIIQNNIPLQILFSKNKSTNNNNNNDNNNNNIDLNQRIINILQLLITLLLLLNE